MKRLMHWLKRPLEIRHGDGDGGQAIEYCLIVAGASALLAYGLMPATGDMAASIATVFGELLPGVAG